MWAHLFKNFTELLANVMLKFLSWSIGKYIGIFCLKPFAMQMQKLLTFLQQKYQCIWKYHSYNS